MGGHGGLNILPQKRWNVYGRDNRLRVARDEEAAAANEKKKLEEERQREKDARYRALLEKQPLEQVIIECEQQVGIGDDPIVEDSRVQSEDVERLAAAVRERGDPKTQTCDRRFDASFKFAKGMQEKPWWLSDTKDSVCDDDDDDDDRRGKTAVEMRNEKRSCLGYVKVKHGSRKSRAREKKKQKKEMYEVLRQERLEREARERNKINSMILH